MCCSRNAERRFLLNMPTMPPQLQHRAESQRPHERKRQWKTKAVHALLVMSGTSFGFIGQGKQCKKLRRLWLRKDSQVRTLTVTVLALASASSVETRPGREPFCVLKKPVLKRDFFPPPP